MVESIVAVKLVVRVPCAIIEHNGKVLAGQRSAALSFPLQWEFPGGKQEENETDEETLVREILEELNVEIDIIQKLPVTTKDQGWREIILVPFVCKLRTHDIVLSEHEQISWLEPQDLPTLDWTEADLGVIQSYYAYLAGK
ncbi:(deoxy)nucleoside triphosphate pyrophosphohydrolase [Dyadobacter sp. LHD-138]|uniref:(deoxy)nucleoside triphosphate pyrophosphohydrolase n=1 Tax=Dyadobacter sp. LHD-138 TaxID=3071413 RepID=UPI0027E1E051|nr:(deoxy)nucleoside triphosphate pyrophosphohydrolase [Dyadobacter sp. LHD-138]MDQ6480414.1 (deoxy)nucleoside triphosphate pyrophosphohydrolase [Dyadobacter sp. LHD-138]